MAGWAIAALLMKHPRLSSALALSTPAHRPPNPWQWPPYSDGNNTKLHEVGGSDVCGLVCVIHPAAHWAGFV